VPKGGRLALVVRTGVGYEDADVPSLTKADVAFAIATEVVRRPTAVAAVTLILAVTTRLMELHRIIGKYCDDYGHSRFEEGSEHFFAYTFEHVTGRTLMHGELVALGSASLALHAAAISPRPRTAATHGNARRCEGVLMDARSLSSAGRAAGGASPLRYFTSGGPRG